MVDADPMEMYGLGDDYEPEDFTEEQLTEMKQSFDL